MADIINLQPHLIGSPANGVNLYQVPNASMEVLQDVINAAWNEGLARKTEFSTKIGAAMTGFLDTATTPHITESSAASQTITEPSVTIPATVDSASVLTAFDTKYGELITALSDKFVAFRAAYFPDESNAYTAVEDWLQAAIANPNAGIPLTVQTQILGEDQARILDEATRATEALTAQFAARRFPLPPGALANATLQIQQKAQDEIAESSRKVAFLSVEQMKFSVEKLMGLRGMAMDSAIKYISALATGPDVASRVVGIGYDAQSKLISSAASFYGARTQAAEVKAKIDQFNATLAQEADAKNQAADLQMVENKLRALLAEAQSIAQMAGALFNNLHASVSMQAGGTTVATQAQDMTPV